MRLRLLGTFDAHLAGVAFADGANIPLGAFGGGAKYSSFIVFGTNVARITPPTLLRTYWPKMKRLGTQRNPAFRGGGQGQPSFGRAIDWLKWPPHFRKWRDVTI